MGSSADTGATILVLIIYVAFVAVFVLGYWKIWSKAGFHGAWSLLMLVPLVNLGAFLYLAFADWPVHKRLGGPDTFN